MPRYRYTVKNKLTGCIKSYITSSECISKAKQHIINFWGKSYELIGEPDILLTKYS